MPPGKHYPECTEFTLNALRSRLTEALAFIDEAIAGGSRFEPWHRVPPGASWMSRLIAWRSTSSPPAPADCVCDDPSYGEGPCLKHRAAPVDPVEVARQGCNCWRNGMMPGEHYDACPKADPVQRVLAVECPVRNCKEAPGRTCSVGNWMPGFPMFHVERIRAAHHTATSEPRKETP